MVGGVEVEGEMEMERKSGGDTGMVMGRGGIDIDIGMGRTGIGIAMGRRGDIADLGRAMARETDIANDPGNEMCNDHPTITSNT
jgi:hypothetical protein